MQGGDDEVDRLDADKGNDDAAQPIDHQVAAQKRAGTDGPIRDALQASGISATMISALKMIADRIALCGLARCMTLSTASCG